MIFLGFFHRIFKELFMVYIFHLSLFAKDIPVLGKIGCLLNKINLFPLDISAFLNFVTIVVEPVGKVLLSFTDFLQCIFDSVAAKEKASQLLILFG